AHPRGRELRRTVEDVVAVRQSFDEAGRLAAQHVADTARGFFYDASGRVTAIGDRSYTADETGRTRAVTVDGEQAERYEYDEAGNLAGAARDWGVGGHN